MQGHWVKSCLLWIGEWSIPSAGPSIYLTGLKIWKTDSLVGLDLEGAEYLLHVSTNFYFLLKKGLGVAVSFFFFFNSRKGLFWPFFLMRKSEIHASSKYKIKSLWAERNNGFCPSLSPNPVGWHGLCQIITFLAAHLPQHAACFLGLCSDF